MVDRLGSSSSQDIQAVLNSVGSAGSSQSLSVHHNCCSYVADLGPAGIGYNEAKGIILAY